jgi:hypothetical protein
MVALLSRVAAYMIQQSAPGLLDQGRGVSASLTLPLFYIEMANTCPSVILTIR